MAADSKSFWRGRRKRGQRFLVMKNLSAVLFDVDGTLYDPGILRFILAVCFIFAWVRHPIRTVKEVHILIHYRRALEWMRNNLSSGVHADSQIKRVAAVTGISLQDVRKCVDRWTRRTPLLFMHLCARRKLIRMIKRWHKMGIPMGIYSDYPSEEKLQKLGIRKCMSVVLCSCDPEVGTYKPDPRGLRVIARKMGQAPEACVYFGDREDTDILGAHRAGMHGLLFSKKNLAWLDAQIKKPADTEFPRPSLSRLRRKLHP